MTDNYLKPFQRFLKLNNSIRNINSFQENVICPLHKLIVQPFARLPVQM